MTIKAGDRIPQATLGRIGENGPEQVALGDLLAGRNVVIFAVPGAFTPTCHSAHVPSFVRTRADFAAKGVDEIICIAVNDPFVMQAWGKDTGAASAGITMLSDTSGAFTKSIGMDFDIAALGMNGRSKRYAMYVVDGEVKVLQEEEKPGVCDRSGGEAMLQAI